MTAIPGHSRHLVDAAELAAHTDWQIFDCRHDLTDPDAGHRAYANGHIPGAHHLHLDHDLSGVVTGRNGRHPLPDATGFAERMAACGINDRSRVVAYDDQGGVYAARLWWMLRWIGHIDVAVLDGGLKAWRSGGHVLETALSTVKIEMLIARCSGGTVTADELFADLSKHSLQVVDARSPERFAGRNETLDPVGGHIPGALNRFYQQNLDPTNGRFKSAPVLRAEFDMLLAGRDPASIVHQCGSGVTACHNLLAMEIAGLPGSLLYPGSWSEWCADPSRPVESTSG